MKRINSYADRFQTVSRIFARYPEAFEGFDEITAAKENFNNKLNRIAELITELNKPAAEYFGVRQDSRQKLRDALRLAIGTGITVAIRQNNAPVLTSLRKYKADLSRTRNHDLPEMARRVYDELKQNEDLAAQSGLKSEKLAALQELTANFREIIQVTDYKLNERRKERDELRTLVTQCHGLLRDQFDAFVSHCRDSFPDMYSEYMTLRKTKRPVRRKKAVNAQTGDISGTVTDSVTGQPIADATITVAEQETTYSTDADGYFLIEDLEAGKYTLTCFADGYALSQQETVDAAEGESLEVNFSMTPAQAAA